MLWWVLGGILVWTVGIGVCWILLYAHGESQRGEATGSERRCTRER